MRHACMHDEMPAAPCPPATPRPPACMHACMRAQITVNAKAYNATGYFRNPEVLAQALEYQVGRPRARGVARCRCACLWWRPRGGPGGGGREGGAELSGACLSAVQHAQGLDPAALHGRGAGL